MHNELLILFIEPQRQECTEGQK